MHYLLSSYKRNNVEILGTCLLNEMREMEIYNYLGNSFVGGAHRSVYVIVEVNPLPINENYGQQYFFSSPCCVAQSG